MAASSSPVGAPRTVRAVVLDTDGVITDSAPTHAAARKKASGARLEKTRPAQWPFDGRDDHRRPADGRSRQEVGVDRTETDDSADDSRRYGTDTVVADPGDPLPGGEAG
ncbi:hypothetical protein OG923_18020 [Streptomyces halstedii]|uniref:hypothetical protein n=1 Tax=Streptomyces halstedii TaxID=1944 RepID=UPI0032501A51